jgi:uncharacterized membrane-anchored protein YhcB (DUF1043 family)
MIQYVPALSLLIAFLTVTLVILAKVKSDQLPALLEAKNALLLFAATLFCILLVVHLFKEQTWTADLLKVVAGVLVGAVTTSTVSTQTAIGNDIQQAGRDINNIKKMLGDLQNVTDSVVNQFQTIQQSVAKVSDTLSAPVVKQEYFHTRVPVPDDRFFTEVQKMDDEQPSFVDGDATRTWLNRRIELFLSVPGARDEIRRALRSIEDAGWSVREIRFDISPKIVDVSFNCEQRLSVDELLQVQKA